MDYGKLISLFALSLAVTTLCCCPRQAHVDREATSPPRFDAVVAADGSGDFTSIQEAIMAAPHSTTPKNRWVVLVKAGTYRELVYVQRERGCIRLVGAAPESTVITYDLHAKVVGLDGKPIGTFRTPTVVVDGDDFVAENITFENAAGPVAQAVALRVDGDRVVFRNCRFLGWQDTILLNRRRVYFRDCYVAGHVDFVFGGGTALFDHCHIHCRGNGYITAASTPAAQPFGFVFSHCTISGEPGVQTYLGRPWRAHAAVAFLNTSMSEVVRPEGWHNWGKPECESTVRFAEWQSSGPGAHPRQRVSWARQLSDAEAKAFTLENVLAGGDGWNPAALSGEVR
ncbi:MAG: pectinesterase family protein [bacterium]|jgi:pectinesterase|nr:pectinesterase family protein [candidate division KSB1 bacterium]MDH7560908.1 pectinesterase family protein [bacterium]